MAEYVDLAERVTATFYSDEYEEWTQQTVTIADVLDSVCDEYTILPSAQPVAKDINVPCSDTISRQAAIDARQQYEKGYDDGKAEALQWIPVSERLPSPLEWDEKYLVSLAWGGIGVMEYKSTGFHNYGSFNPVPIETVTAWMPLPEPYRGEQE